MARRGVATGGGAGGGEGREPGPAACRADVPPRRERFPAEQGLAPDAGEWGAGAGDGVGGPGAGEAQR